MDDRDIRNNTDEKEYSFRRREVKIVTPGAVLKHRQGHGAERGELDSTNLRNQIKNMKKS
jgi:hypothetical protein